MRNWRVLTAVAAVVLAALAGVLVWKYTQNAKTDAQKPYTLVNVLVASRPISANTSYASALEQGEIAKAQYLKKNVPPDAIAATAENLSAAKSSFKNRYSSHDIPSDVPLTSDDFVAQGAVVSGLAGQLQSDNTAAHSKAYEAVTLSIDDQHAVAGMLRPGDSVNAVYTGPVKDVTNQNGSGVHVTAYLLPGLKILSIGSQTLGSASTASSSTTPTTVANANRSLITFEVTPRQAEQLLQGASLGTLTLTLNPTSFKRSDFQFPAEIVETVNLFDQNLTLAQQTLAQIKANAH